MRVEEGLFDPKPWSARGIEKSKKGKPAAPHRYSVHMSHLSTEQLFGLFAMDNIKRGIQLFGFGLAKIKGRYYLYVWNPTEYSWGHPTMKTNKLTRKSSEINANRLSIDFTDEMADDLSHWIKNKETFGISSGRVWPLYATESESDSYEGIIVFGNDAASVRKYKKIYDKLVNGRDALPIERDGDYTGNISEIPNNFQIGSWLSVDLDPEEIMSLGIGQRDIRDDTAGKAYGEVTLNDLHESKTLLTDDPTSAAFNLTKLKGYLRCETKWDYDEDLPEDAMLVDKVHEPPRFTVNWIGPEGRRHPNTYCVNVRRDRGESWTWVTHFCLKASDAAELIDLEVRTWEHNNEPWRFGLQESEKSFPGLSKYMKADVERIFKYNPDRSEDEFLNAVIGEGDEGYDPECAAVMWEYYEYLQSR